MGKKLIGALLLSLTLGSTSAHAQHLYTGQAQLTLPYQGDFDPHTRQFTAAEAGSFRGTRQHAANLTNHRYQLFRLVIDVDAVYQISMSRVGHGLRDPYLLLLDGQRNVLAEDDDSGRRSGDPNTEYDALIRSVPLRSGTYYIVATTFVHDDAGYYRLNVTRLGVMPRQ